MPEPVKPLTDTAIICKKSPLFTFDFLPTFSYKLLNLQAERKKHFL